MGLSELGLVGASLEADLSGAFDDPESKVRGLTVLVRRACGE